MNDAESSSPEIPDPADGSPSTGWILTPAEVRVMGCLIEKELATPDYYPLTLAALMAACNQKSNRDPVLQLGEQEIEKTLQALRYEKKWVTMVREAGGRVPKYKHELQQHIDLTLPEKAVLAELMLRGPQTLGELRTRIPRMAGPSSSGEVESALENLKQLGGMQWVTQLPRLAGHREARYAHLLEGPVLQDPGDADAGLPRSGPPPSPREEDRVSALESEVRVLQQKLEDLEGRFAKFCQSFE